MPSELMDSLPPSSSDDTLFYKCDWPERLCSARRWGLSELLTGDGIRLSSDFLSSSISYVGL